MNLDTPRLQLIPHDPRHLAALGEGEQAYFESSGLRAAEGLGDFGASEETSPAWFEKLRAARGPDPWAFGFAVVHLASRSVIGMAGYKGPADGEGAVEIAYAIVPAYQSQGYATEAARALVDFAAASDGVRLVRAHTLPESNPSTKVLTKCGFEFVGEVVDPEDGLVWRWER